MATEAQYKLLEALKAPNETASRSAIRRSWIGGLKGEIPVCELRSAEAEEEARMARKDKDSLIKSDVLTLMHTYDAAPADFKAHEAAPHDLRKYGHPRRPDAKREPRLAELWRQAYSRPMRYTKAELAIDPIMSKTGPAEPSDRGAGEGRQRLPAGWLGWHRHRARDSLIHKLR
jgi:hypothetical protein